MMHQFMFCILIELFTSCIDFVFDDEIPDVVLELLQNIFADMYRILLHLC